MIFSVSKSPSDSKTASDSKSPNDSKSPSDSKTPSDSSEPKLFFLLWGSTGAGKSSFIKACGATVTVKDMKDKDVELQPFIGHDLDSCKFLTSYAFLTTSAKLSRYRSCRPLLFQV